MVVEIGTLLRFVDESGNLMRVVGIEYDEYSVLDLVENESYTLYADEIFETKEMAMKAKDNSCAAYITKE